MTIKAVIFDLGGVIVRTEFPQVRHRLEQELGLEPRTLDRVIWGGEDWELAQVGQITYEEYWERVGSRLGLSTQQEISDFRRQYFSGDRVDQELVDLIAALRSHYKIGLLSNAPDKLETWLEGNWGIKNLFDAIVYSARAGMTKPDPRMYHLILDQLSVSVAEALFIDDYPRNVDAALSLGMKAIRFTGTADLVDQLRQYIAWSSEGADD